MFVTYNTVCYGQKVKGDSLESNTYFHYAFEASTHKNNPLRSKSERSLKNQAQKIKGQFSQSGFFLYLDTSHIVKTKEGLLCHQLFLVNNTDSVMSFPSLSFESEILDNEGKWKSLLNKQSPSSDHYAMMNCNYGFDDYVMYLSPKEYWAFKVPVLKGSHKTKLRYRYFYHGAYAEFSSAIVDVYVNPEKLNNNLHESTNPAYILSPRHTNKSSRSVISLDRMNVVYKGLNNPITVDIMDAKPKDIYLKLSCGRALKDTSNPHYFYILLDSAYNGERELTIEVFTKNNFDSLEVQGSHQYRILSLPKPTLMLGSIENNGPCVQGLLRSASFVFANLKNLQYEGVWYTVTGYSIFWEKLSGEKLAFEAEGNTIPIDIKRAFNFAKPGDTFTLKNVKVIGPLGIEEELKETLTITVK